MDHTWYHHSLMSFVIINDKAESVLMYSLQYMHCRAYSDKGCNLLISERHNVFCVSVNIQCLIFSAFDI